MPEGIIYFEHGLLHNNGSIVMMDMDLRHDIL
jgi:hypothetical protein